MSIQQSELTPGTTALQRLYYKRVRLQANSIMSIFKDFSMQLKQMQSKTELAIAAAYINRSDEKYVATSLANLQSNKVWHF